MTAGFSAALDFDDAEYRLKLTSVGVVAYYQGYEIDVECAIRDQCGGYWGRIHPTIERILWEEVRWQ